MPGAAAGWPAVRGWTLDTLRDRVGERRVALHDFTRRGAVETRMDAFLDRLIRGDAGAHYLAWETALLDRRMAAEAPVRALFPGRIGAVHAALWIGGPGAHTPLHHDTGAPNLHAVISGRKRFLFLAPGDTRNLYPADVYEWSTVFSEVDVRRPDLRRHPRLARARAFEVVLEPGDVVHVPVGWWHAVWCLEPSISINGWWLGPSGLLSARRVRDVGRALLHRAGLLSPGRCTCCGHGDLRRHLGWSETPC